MKRLDLSRRLGLSAILIFLTAVVMRAWFGDVEHWNTPADYKPDDHDKVHFTDLLYFSTVTWFTVGFGDFTPRTPALKWFVALKIFGSYALLVA